MKKDMMNIVACPVCKGDLQLRIAEEQGDEVVTGSLYCGKCSRSYPISETIPNLLPPGSETEIR